MSPRAAGHPCTACPSPAPPGAQFGSGSSPPRSWSCSPTSRPSPRACSSGTPGGPSSSGDRGTSRTRLRDRSQASRTDWPACPGPCGGSCTRGRRSQCSQTSRPSWPTCRRHKVCSSECGTPPPQTWSRRHTECRCSQALPPRSAGAAYCHLRRWSSTCSSPPSHPTRSRRARRAPRCTPGSPSGPQSSSSLPAQSGYARTVPSHSSGSTPTTPTTPRAHSLCPRRTSGRRVPTRSAQPADRPGSSARSATRPRPSGCGG
mmetsp:Transcript_79187/g.224425  ORF Transcript_79187/g.224425 Transcript_79187/m.224425 type:complete len:260 (-) Transcript_79187:737-1516(-)